MPVFKIVWEFDESNGSSFNEVYYTEAANPGDATGFSARLLNARLALLHPLNTWRRVRASQVDQNRVTAVRGIALPGTASPVYRPLPVGASVVCQLSGLTGGQRKLWLRGCPENFYTRSTTSGADEPSPLLLKLLDDFFSALKGNSYGLRKLTPTGVGFFFPRKISKVEPGTQAGQSVITLDQAPGYPVPGRVVIGGASKKDLPALNGHYSIIKVDAEKVTILYQTPNNVTVSGGKATMRLEQYSSVIIFSLAGSSFDHFGTRTSRNPLSHSRGARRAARLRSSL